MGKLNFCRDLISQSFRYVKVTNSADVVPACRRTGRRHAGHFRWLYTGYSL